MPFKRSSSLANQGKKVRTITSGSNVSDKDLNPMLIAVDKTQQMQARITPVGKGKKIVQSSVFGMEMGG